MNKQMPFVYSKPIRTLVAVVFIAVGALLLIIGNIKGIESVAILGAPLGPTISGFGFSIWLLAVLQWIFDHKHRESFFKDVRAEVISSQSLIHAGINQIYKDSKSIDFTQLVEQARSIEIGITYSDRFLKDYITPIKKNKKLTITVYHSDDQDDEIVRMIAISSNQKPQEIKSHFEKLQKIAQEIRDTGVKVTLVGIKSLPKYAFFRFDGEKSFIIPSTFSRRRSSVPAIEVGRSGFLSDFLNDDIPEQGGTPR